MTASRSGGFSRYSIRARGLTLSQATSRTTPGHRPTPGAVGRHRQLELIGNQLEAIGHDSNRPVRVSGVLEEQDGATGYVDQVQSARGAVFLQLRVTRFEPVAGSCTIDPRNLSAAPEMTAISTASNRRRPDLIPDEVPGQLPGCASLLTDDGV
jgi:hypothetical protein